MTRRGFLLGLLSCITIVIGYSSYARNAGWKFLGSAHINGQIDHDKIKCQGADTFNKIQLRVKGSEVQFDRVVVVFDDDHQEMVPVRERIRAGGQTRAYDLPGDRRDIKYVELWYQKARWGAKPEVQLYGK